MRVEVMKSQLAEFAKHDFVAGAIFWCYQDYKSHRNLWPGLTTDWVEMGLVDENRQRLPSYGAWKEQTSPARLAVAWTRGEGGRPTGFRATVERRPATELPSYELRGYRLEWEARDHDGTLLGSGSRGPAGDRRPRPSSRARGRRRPRARFGLALRVCPPDRLRRRRATERWWEPRSGGRSLLQLLDRDVPELDEGGRAGPDAVLLLPVVLEGDRALRGHARQLARSRSP